MFSITGDCQMLIKSEKERLCRDLIINTEYDIARVGFYFFDESEDGGIISFSGMGQQQRFPAEDLRLQPIDVIIMSGIRTPAVGICSFENPFIGSARFQCSAFIESGELFSGFFLSDGSDPQPMSP
jgi:hypothetical protein